MKNIMINQANVERIEEELDDALMDCFDAPEHVIVKIVLSVLDTAQKEKRLNSLERQEACNYITECYGYNF